MPLQRNTGCMNPIALIEVPAAMKRVLRGWGPEATTYRRNER